MNRSGKLISHRHPNAPTSKRTENTIYFDAVIVAAGTFNEHNFPTELDLGSWEEFNPGTIIHSKDFRDAEDFKDKVM